MSTRRLYGGIGVWLAVVGLGMSLAASLGMPVTIGTGVLAVFAGLVPAAIMLKLWGGEPTRTVAELLYSSDRKL